MSPFHIKNKECLRGALLVALVMLACNPSSISLPTVPPSQAPTTGDSKDLAQCGSVPCPSKGSPNAPVTMVEVSDYGCSHCRNYNLDTEPKIDEQYIKTGRVRYIVHLFGFSGQTQAVAAAALCANDQGKFWVYHSLLLKNQAQLDASDLVSYAQQVGLDTKTFTACTNSGKYLADIVASSQAAQAAGVTGAPSFFINGKLVVGAQPFSDFQTHIEAALQGNQ